jgi:hypothetical protein
MSADDATTALLPSAPAEPRAEPSENAAPVVEAGAPATDGMSPEDRQQVLTVLSTEYGVLAGLLSTVWSASLVRTSLFLGVVSALGVALGFAAQASGGLGPTFTGFALVALPLALFLGLATFARTVEIQREAMVYITGMNRIRWFMTQQAPAALPYLVLSIHDDEAGVYRSQGAGMRLRPPRSRLVLGLVQTQGIVAVVSAALAGIIGGLATAWVTAVGSWLLGGAAFVVTLVLLFGYWSRSLREIRVAIRPLNPTPPAQGDPVI